MALDIFAEIVRLRAAGTPAALATITRTQGSTPGKMTQRMVVRGDGTTAGSVGGGCIEADVVRAALDAIDTGQPRILSFRLSGEDAARLGIACGGTLDVMVESLHEPHVIIIGAGHIGKSLAPLAKRCGFRVTVVDDRPDFASAARFPDADEVLVAPITDLAPAVRTGPAAHIVVCTRGHDLDLDALRFALRTPARYVGVVGSRRKKAIFAEALLAEGVPAEAVDAIRIPIGVDIGAETMDEIAVSIAAELVRARRVGLAPAGGS